MPRPNVTGISPREGRPGRQITIRGENLGVDGSDVKSIRIVGYECVHFAEYQSSSKILCRVGPVPGEGDVIVTTRSGGEGTCTVTFRCDTQNIDPMEELSVWVDEPDPYAIKAKKKVFTHQKEVDPLGTQKAFPRIPSAANQLDQLYPDGSSDLMNENFNPARFLIERHRTTHFEELSLGLVHLKKVNMQLSVGPKALVKNNLETFIECHETLTAMHQLLLRNESMSEGGSLTEKLEFILKDTVKCAEDLFHDVLSRKDRADSMRNALNIMQRFRFLFSLPRNIEKNIKNGEYEIVINDYERAKSLFADTEVQVFKKVLTEVETLVKNFRGQLLKKLQELPSTLDEQKRLIRYLMELHAEGDPAWACIQHQQEWLIRLILSCKADYQCGDHITAEMDPIIVTGAGIPQLNIQVDSIDNPPNNTSSTDRGFGKDDAKTPQLVLFVEELSALVTESLPDLWRLAQAYFSGSLVQGMDSSKLRNRTPQGEKKFQSMINAITNLYSDLIRASFFPGFLEELMGGNRGMKERREAIGEYEPFEDCQLERSSAWLPFCVRQIRSTLNTLQDMSLKPEVLLCIAETGIVLQSHCANVLTQQTVLDIRNLHVRENWKVETDEGGCITSLPILFENRIMDWVLSLKEVILDDSGPAVHEGKQKSLEVQSTQLFIKVLCAFAGCLNSLTLSENTIVSDEETGAPRQSIAYAASSLLGGHDVVEDAPTLTQQLLIVMSNCSYCYDVVIARLANFFEGHGYPGGNEAKVAALEALREVDDKAFDRYIELRSQPIMARLEEGIFSGGYNFAECARPKGVRPYLKDMLLELVRVHLEVFSISTSLVRRVLTALLDIIAETLYITLKEKVPEFSTNGALQAKLEILALEQSLSAYKSEESITHLKMSKDLLSHADISADDQVVLLDLVMEFRQANLLQLLCFVPTRRTSAKGRR
ncbi:exocyst complex component 2-like [Sycon ciliatum]|uniref:exocyst complex component 2-like n=1 Tax=Sycon ciliatum TaxID=27933 RepID=UPI0031F66FE0|eukprot:scpid34601/ scgid28855/ Exocyst complex component 2; Exocyst complex component Sec5